MNNDNISVRLAKALARNSLNIEDCVRLGPSGLSQLPGFESETIAEAMRVNGITHSTVMRRLLNIRLRAGLSVREFSEALGISVDHYINYENGLSKIPLKVVRTLVQKFGENTDWFLPTNEGELAFDSLAQLSKQTLTTNNLRKLAGEREKPANRRRSENREIKWRPPHNPDAPETNIHVTIGYAECGLRAVEIFYDSGYRSGSDLETQVSDICILISIMLQHEDVQTADFCGSIAQERDLLLGEDRPGSIVGVLLEELQRQPEWAADVIAAGLPDGN